MNSRLLPYLIWTKNWGLKFWELSAACLFICACAAQQSSKPFHFQRCMDTVPGHVRGLKILSGPRNEQSIINDMVPAVCAAQLRYHQMKIVDDDIGAGAAVFRITVEYTGEVLTARIEESAIKSQPFLRSVADSIANTDFVGWARDESDTVFLYPVRFGE